MADLIEIEARITGRVQMVMFRDFIQRKARSLSINGEVENMDDKSVRVIAQGSEESLNKLIEYLHKGPLLAKVARADIDWRDVGEKFQEFSIKY
ncbi:acylphosphatase [Candidatus Pacearchaeota archaeon]|nr:acylphosphatase [Candidatus Pacearchaeota archaeon]